MRDALGEHGFEVSEAGDGKQAIVTEPFRFERSSHAIVSGDLDILTGMPSWSARLLADPVDIRIQGTSGKELFIGIAPTADVDRYLSGVAHDEVTDLDIDGRSIAKLDYVSRQGVTPPAAPRSERFWEVRTEGTGPSPSNGRSSREAGLSWS